MLQREGCGGVSTLAFWYFLVQQALRVAFRIEMSYKATGWLTQNSCLCDERFDFVDA